MPVRCSASCFAWDGDGRSGISQRSRLRHKIPGRHRLERRPSPQFLCEFLEDIMELIDHAPIESIPSVGPVQRDAGHTISRFNLYGGQRRSSVFPYMRKTGGRDSRIGVIAATSRQRPRLRRVSERIHNAVIPQTSRAEIRTALLFVLRDDRRRQPALFLF